MGWGCHWGSFGFGRVGSAGPLLEEGAGGANPVENGAAGPGRGWNRRVAFKGIIVVGIITIVRRRRRRRINAAIEVDVWKVAEIFDIFKRRTSKIGGLKFMFRRWFAPRRPH